MIVTVSGPPGSGKTTVAQQLAEELHAQLLLPGQLFRELAAARGLTLEAFGKLALQDSSIDRALDERTVEAARRATGPLVIEGRLAAQMLLRAGIAAFKAYLQASLEVRVSRIIEREEADAHAVRREIQEREAVEQQRYRAWYGIDLTDLSIYDLVIVTDRLSAPEVVTAIRRGLEGHDVR